MLALIRVIIRPKQSSSVWNFTTTRSLTTTRYPNTKILRKANKFVLRKILRWVRLAMDDIRFDADSIAIRYKNDTKIKPSEWCLIYSEPVFTFYFNMANLLFLMVPYYGWCIAIDYWENGKITNEFLIRKYHDLLQFGEIRYAFIILAVFVMAMLLRFQAIQISKIYINRQNPEELYIHASRYIFFRRWVKINRRDISVMDFERRSDFIRLLSNFYGSIKFGKLGLYTITPNGFRTNAFRTYVLNHTNVVPKSLESLDFKLLKIEKL